MRGTSEAAAVGLLGENLDLPSSGATNTGTLPKKGSSANLSAPKLLKKNTIAEPAAGDENEEEKKEVPVKVNHYKEMGLEDTSIIKRIANQVGLTIQKKTTKGGSKSTGAKNKSAGKSNTAKKKAGLNAA